MADAYPFLSHRIFFTPLVSENVYGTSVDVTQDIDVSDFIKSVGTIRREIDNGDNDFGIFTFGNIELTAINFTGKFNDQNDNGRSIFPYLRDRTKVEIEFRNKSDTASTRFKGIINDDVTRHNLRSDAVKFTVLSLDSILRQVKVQPGSVVTGDLFSLAIKKILNVPEITSTLTYSASNITVDLDLTIDEGETFSNSIAKDSLDELLLASNSILYIDETDTVYVKPRTESATLYNLYGRGDQYGRNSILEITDYNNGLHRAFNSIKVNSNTVRTADEWVESYGFRQKSITFDFISDRDKEQEIGDRLLREFQVPKLELQVVVRTEDVLGIELLDSVSVNYPKMLFPDPAYEKLPMFGVAEYGTARYAIEKGSFGINPNISWKVIGIDENPGKFTTTLKLRQAGVTMVGGYFASDYPTDDSGNYPTDDSGNKPTA